MTEVPWACEPPDLWPDEGDNNTLRKPVVQLTWAEMLQGVVQGAMRNIEDVFAGRTHADGGKACFGWQNNIEGALGEMAFAKWRNLYWAGKGSIGDPDVANMQVRTTLPGGALRLHKRDKDDDVFWLMRGVNGRYVVEGWLRAREGKLDGNWKVRNDNGRPPAYWVEVDKLHAPEEQP